MILKIREKNVFTLKLMTSVSLANIWWSTSRRMLPLRMTIWRWKMQCWTDSYGIERPRCGSVREWARCCITAGQAGVGAMLTCLGVIKYSWQSSKTKWIRLDRYESDSLRVPANTRCLRGRKQDIREHNVKPTGTDRTSVRKWSRWSAMAGRTTNILWDGHQRYTIRSRCRCRDCPTIAL